MAADHRKTGDDGTRQMGGLTGGAFAVGAMVLGALMVGRRVLRSARNRRGRGSADPRPAPDPRKPGESGRADDGADRAG